MQYQRVTKPAITLIGLTKSGAMADSATWIEESWLQLAAQLAAGKFLINDEVSHFWGAMTDRNHWLDPWLEQGTYLAGIEVPAGTPCPWTWTKWILPAQEYVVVRTTFTQIEEAVAFVFEEVSVQEQVRVIGAIQEYYGADFSPLEVALYFPIRNE